MMRPYDSSSDNPNLETETAVVAEVAGQRRSGKRGSKQGKANGGGGDHGGGQSEHEMHIWTERERRKKMRNMFSSLHALLPQLPAKADKSTIVDEAVTYIKNLQQTLQTLEKKKLEKLRSSTTAVDYDQSSIITSEVQVPESREAFLIDNQGPTNDYPLTIDMPQTFPAQMSPACFQTWFSSNVVISMCGDDAQINVCSPRKPGTLATILYILEKHRLEVVSAQVSSDQYRSMYMIHVHAGGVSEQFPAALSIEETFKLAAGEMNLCLFSG
ncbi:Serine/threonine-protein kinase [Hibiscus syriacus]|uniref:Serine/threonine-protein kinase n=2 Tax=Hibiscus syriacus TaxID=106335 RepID=A0A6A3D6K4_HIBSY|nr:Serine/threonine-protein kinase [Hibiscus syriacus]